MRRQVKMLAVTNRISYPSVELMEARQLLSAAVHSALQLPKGWKATLPTGLTHFLNPAASTTGSTTPYGFTPDQIRNAYGLGSYGSSTVTFGNVQGDGTGQTIAIVDAYDDPNALSDLQHFDVQFGLPDPPSFQKLSQTGSTAPTMTDPAGAGNSKGTWEEEESLDIAWAHVTAPKANIILYEASNTSSGLYTAVKTADKNTVVSVISMSWGGSEFSGETSNDRTYFNTAGITYVASTGDSGGALEYPANSVNVVAAGGTSLSISNNAYGSESAWSSGGGGTSTQEPQPSYQNNTATGSTTNRTTPDVSMDADPNTGVPIYDSFDFGTSAPWIPGTIGGTSLAAPLFAGIITVADQGHVAAGAGKLTGNTQVLPELYALPSSNFHDIASGSNTHPATIGYDRATGIGSPVGNLLITDLAGTETITGEAFVDNNGNSTFDGTDTVLANKTVYLDENNNGLQDSNEPTTTTTSAGVYTFTNQPAGGAVRLVASSITGFAAIPQTTVSFASTNSINVPIFPTSFITPTTSENFTLQMDSTGTTDQILINGSQTYSVPASAVNSIPITFKLTDTTDSFTINGSNGNPIPAAGITVAGTGGNTLSVIGTATVNDAFIVTSNSISFSSSPVSFSNVSLLLLNPGAGLDSLAVNSGAVTIAARSSGSGILTRNFSTLSVASAASALFATAPLHINRMLVETSTLSASGVLDLGGNDLIVHNGDLGAITGLLGTGFAGGAWNGKGIASSAAAGDTSQTTAVGVIQNSLYGGTDQPLFDGIAPTTSDVLLKYTYYGDTNLDGKVDGTDYSRVDSAFLFAATGWFNGDFNYDSSVNGSDYTLIDNAFNMQGPSL